MAKLISYTVANGGQAVDYPYQAEVRTQQEIEQHRKLLHESLNKPKEDYSIFFGIRKEQGSRLTP